MRTDKSLFSNIRSQHVFSSQIDVEEQIRKENDALLDSLANNVGRMKSAAAGLGQEVREQNEYLSNLSDVFVKARNGVGISVHQLRGVVSQYGWKCTVYFVLAFLALLYILYKLLL